MRKITKTGRFSTIKLSTDSNGANHFESNHKISPSLDFIGNKAVKMTPNTCC